MVQEVYRRDRFNEIKNLVNSIGPGSIFLVRGNRSYEDSGASAFVEELLGTSRIDSFRDFKTNPQSDDLASGVSRFREGTYELILAIGGGSVLDMAKLISMFVHQEAKTESIIRGKTQPADTKTPVLAVPTTAGTGAEATKFAVVYLDQKKHSFEHPLILPDYVYLSPVFLHSSDPYLSACAGLDAFSQAVESVWSVNSTDESESIALDAIELIWKNLRKAAPGGDEIAMENMLEASHLSGRAINITRTTAPHALSYAFTSYYGIPHGHAVALTLPFFLEYNYHVTGKNCTDKRGYQSVKARIDKILGLLGCGIGEVRDLLGEFFRSIGIDTDIRSLAEGFDPEIIINNVNTERLSNNPRLIEKNDLRTLFHIQHK